MKTLQYLYNDDVHLEGRTYSKIRKKYKEKKYKIELTKPKNKQYSTENKTQ